VVAVVGAGVGMARSSVWADVELDQHLEGVAHGENVGVMCVSGVIGGVGVYVYGGGAVSGVVRGYARRHFVGQH